MTAPKRGTGVRERRSGTTLSNEDQRALRLFIARESWTWAAAALGTTVPTLQIASSGGTVRTHVAARLKARLGEVSA